MLHCQTLDQQSPIFLSEKEETYANLLFTLMRELSNLSSVVEVV